MEIGFSGTRRLDHFSLSLFRVILKIRGGGENGRKLLMDKRDNEVL